MLSSALQRYRKRYGTVTNPTAPTQAQIEAAMPPSVVSSSADGFAPSVIWLDTTPEYYGAKGDGVTNDTAAFQLCSEAIKAAGGGVMRLSARTYIVDGYVWETGVKHQGRGIRGVGTVLKAAAGSANPAQITQASGVVNGGAWKDLRLVPNGNAGQTCMYFYAENSGAGGVFNSEFDNLQIGGPLTGEPWEGDCMWWRGGATSSTSPHQYITFSKVICYRANTGTYATTNRCMRRTGQCEKFEFDAACFFNGATAKEKVGTNIEDSREFLFAAALSAEATAGANEITLPSVTGFETNKRFSIGEGNSSELCQVESVTGSTVKLKSALALTHASGTRTYLLSGTVSSPATLAPSRTTYASGAIQNADLAVLVDSGVDCNFNGTDFEETSRTLKRRHQSYQVNLNSCVVTNASSEGVSNGEGVATVGSKILTGVTGTWTEGEKINGPGIKTTVAKTLGAGEIELTAAVTANGTANATKVFLVKGGSGQGYVTNTAEGSQGKNEYHLQGASDQGDISTESGVVEGNLTRATQATTQTSSGVVLPIAAASTVTIYSCAKVELLNAAATIKTIVGQHGTGQSVTFRASTANTIFEVGGNIFIPAGKLILQVNDIAVFQRTDYGTFTWELIAVQRAEEQSFVVPGLFAPIWGENLIIQAVEAFGTAYKAVFQRCIVRKTGHLEKLWIPDGSTLAGHVRVALFDLGQTTSGKLTCLYEGAEVAQSGSEKWLLCAEPNYAVTAGQELMVAFMSDSATAVFGRYAAHAGSDADELPPGFEEHSIAPRVLGFHTYASLSFGGVAATLNEITAGGLPWAVIGKIE